MRLHLDTLSLLVHVAGPASQGRATPRPGLQLLHEDVFEALRGAFDLNCKQHSNIYFEHGARHFLDLFWIFLDLGLRYIHAFFWIMPVVFWSCYAVRVFLGLPQGFGVCQISDIFREFLEIFRLFPDSIRPAYTIPVVSVEKHVGRLIWGHICSHLSSLSISNASRLQTPGTAQIALGNTCFQASGHCRDLLPLR